MTKERIKGWKVNSEFYLHEIALLMLGLDPSNYTKDDLLKNNVADFLPRYRLVLDEACSYIGYRQSEEYPGEHFKAYELITNNKPEHMEVISPEEGFQIKASSGYIVEWIKRRRSGGNPLSDKFFTVDVFDAENEHGIDAGKPLFDEKDPKYSRELDWAVKAWQAVSQSDGKGTPKKRIKDWLDKNAKANDGTELFSHEAKMRIATMANWKKEGGAPPTE